MAILQTNDIFKTELSEGQHRLSPEEIHKVQQVVYGITIDITELCSELNIPYMLTGGTALGAVRHGGFIPWDDDVDIYMPRDDWLSRENILNVCLMRLNRGIRTGIL